MNFENYTERIFENTRNENTKSYGILLRNLTECVIMYLQRRQNRNEK